MNTYHHVTNWSNGPRNVMNINGPTNDGLSFHKLFLWSVIKLTTKCYLLNSNQGACLLIDCMIFLCKVLGHECPKAPAVTTPNETAVIHVLIRSGKFTDDDVDSSLEFSF